MRLVIAFASLIPALVACTSIDSSDIETSGIHPAISLRSTTGADGTDVSVSLHVGNSITTFVELEGDDSLTATAGDETVTLTENNLLGAVAYNGKVATKTPGDVVTIAFTRAEKESALDSNIALTEALTLTAPAGGATASRAADLEIAWTSEASDDQVTVSWSGSCVQDGSRDVTAGALSLTLEAGTIAKREPANEDEQVPDDCDVSLSVSRKRSGTIDPAFGGGSISHTFSDSVTMTSQP